MTLEEKWQQLVAIVNEQAKDPDLWFLASDIETLYLQQELRRLHEAIDGMTQEEGAARGLRKLIYDD
jgi:hypothetical protein